MAWGPIPKYVRSCRGLIEIAVADAAPTLQYRYLKHRQVSSIKEDCYFSPRCNVRLTKLETVAALRASVSAQLNTECDFIFVDGEIESEPRNGESIKSGRSLFALWVGILASSRSMY